MPQINLGKVRMTDADYAVNDPNHLGYIANRPCFFTGKFIEETLMNAVSVEIGTGKNYSGKPMKAGEKYRLTIKGTLWNTLHLRRQ